MFKSITSKLRTIVIVLMMLVPTQLATPVPAEASWDSAADYVKNVPWGSSYVNHWSICANPNKIMTLFDIFPLFSVNMPTSLPPTGSQSSASQAADIVLATTMSDMLRVNYNFYNARLVMAIASLGTSEIAYAILNLIWTDVCTNTFIMQPHEYVNYENNWVTVQNNKNVDPCAVSRDDVPYYFQCSNPSGYGYNKEACYGAPTSGGSCNCKSSRTVGGTCSCSLPDGSTVTGTPPSFCLARSGNVGSIVVGYDGPIFTHNTNGSSAFKPATIYHLNPNDISKRVAMTPMSSVLYAYFYQNPMRGGLQACVASPSTVPPVFVGCAPIAPPTQPSFPPDSYYGSTRCLYVSQPRADLVSLAGTLSSTDSAGHSSASVSNFLRGSIHMTSNVVGCIKDLMIQVAAIPYGSEATGFFATIQSGMRSMVYAMLTLYVTLVGIKIMSSAHELKRGEYIMFLVKFALVAYFITPSAWYQVDGTKTVGGVSGLLPALIFGADQVAAFMTDALNAGDPVGMCRYQMTDGTQLLTERLTSGAGAGSGAITPTSGYASVKLTIWDFFDCKLVNYLNFGSCNYTFKGMMGVWMIALCMSFAIVPMIFAIIMIVYCLHMIKILCKLVSMFVLSAVIITVLVLLSPLFIAFSLFTLTKGMFDKWMNKLFAYAIYPALLTGAMCLTLAVVDAVYNGTYSGSSMTISLSSTKSEAQQIVSMCQDNDGLFCQTVKYTGSPCSSSVGKISDSLTQIDTIGFAPIEYSTKSLVPDVISSYFKAIMPLMLMMVLLSSFFNSMIEVVESIAGVHGLSAAHNNSVVGKALSAVMDKAKQVVKHKASEGMDKLDKYGKGGGDDTKKR